MNPENTPNPRKKTSTAQRSRGRQCAAFGCVNYEYNADGTRSSLHLFSVPKTNPRKKRWCDLMQRKDGKDGFKVGQSTVICEKHFKKEDISRGFGGMVRLKPGTEPLKSNTPSPKKRKAPKQRSPQLPKANISKKLCTQASTMESHTETAHEKSVGDPSDMVTAEADEVTLVGPTMIDQSTQTEMHSTEMSVEMLDDVADNINTDHTYSFSFKANSCDDLVEAMEERLQVTEEKLNNLITKVGQLQKEIDHYKEREFTLDKYKDDPTAIQFYTGFPNYEALLAFHVYIVSKVDKLQYWGAQNVPDSRPYQEDGKKKPGPKRKLSSLKELFIVLIRLKTGLFVRDLSERFDISMGHFSKIYVTWINFLYFELKELFPFPPQDVIRKNMPEQFALYPTTRVIIDCTEIFVEVPSSMTAQSQTWSNYKHHNTFKALVGISPNGQVIFISKLWGGRVSDKYITDKSNLVQHLKSGDNVMADRGFDILDLLPQGVGLNIPPFKGTRGQLTAEEVRETARIAAVRIHVERAIGRIKNYHILDGTMPLSLAHVADQTFTVCAYLTNFSPPLLPPANPKNKK